MSLESDLRAYLLTKSGITDLIGTGSTARAYIHARPSGKTDPALLLTRISTSRTPDIDGAAGYADARTQIDCLAANALDAASLAAAVRSALDGLGSVTTQLNSSTTLYAARLENETSLYLPPADQSDRGNHQIALEFALLIAETLPAH